MAHHLPPKLQPPATPLARHLEPKYSEIPIPETLNVTNGELPSDGQPLLPRACLHIATAAHHRIEIWPNPNSLSHEPGPTSYSNPLPFLSLKHHLSDYPKLSFLSYISIPSSVSPFAPPNIFTRPISHIPKTEHTHSDNPFSVYTFLSSCFNILFLFLCFMIYYFKHWSKSLDLGVAEGIIRKDSDKMGCIQNYGSRLRASPYLDKDADSGAACINDLGDGGLANVEVHGATDNDQRQRVEPETANFNNCAGDRYLDIALDTSDRCLQTSPYLTKVDDSRAACFKDLDDSRLTIVEKLGQPSNDHNKRVDPVAHINNYKKSTQHSDQQILQKPQGSLYLGSVRSLPANASLFAGDGVLDKAVDMRQMDLANSNTFKTNPGDHHITRGACFQISPRLHREHVSNQCEGVQVTTKDKKVYNSASNSLSELRYTDLNTRPFTLHRRTVILERSLKVRSLIAEDLGEGSNLIPGEVLFT